MSQEKHGAVVAVRPPGATLPRAHALLALLALALMGGGPALAVAQQLPPLPQPTVPGHDIDHAAARSARQTCGGAGDDGRRQMSESRRRAGVAYGEFWIWRWMAVVA